MANPSQLKAKLDAKKQAEQEAKKPFVPPKHRPLKNHEGLAKLKEELNDGR